MKPTHSAFVCALLSFAFSGCVAQSTISIRLNRQPDSEHSFDVTGLSARQLSACAEAKLGPDDWNALFAIYVASKNADTPPTLGTYKIEKELLRFEPQFPLTAGLTYRAVFNPAKLLGQAGAKHQAVVKEFVIPKPDLQPTAIVERVFPSGESLPENQLRFYIHFSAPMRKGDAFQHIRLLDSDGKLIDQAFLELEDELWDRDGKRFTLFFNPGRVKKGLEPREELGPILVAGKSYTLEIDRQWLDARGAPMKESFRKRFKAGPAEEARLDSKTWKIQTPPAGTREPVIVRFPRPLDHALLHRLLWLTDSKGQRVTGKIAVADAETTWNFTPDSDWEPGSYHLVSDTRLEDRAGNSISRPFEVDVFHPLENEIKTETVRVSFQIR